MENGWFIQSCLDPYSIGILDRLNFLRIMVMDMNRLDPYSTGILDRLKY